MPFPVGPFPKHFLASCTCQLCPFNLSRGGGTHVSQETRDPSTPLRASYGAPDLNAQPILTFHNFSERDEQAIYFFGGVVVDKADAEEAAGFFHVELLGEI